MLRFTRQIIPQILAEVDSKVPLIKDPTKDVKYIVTCIETYIL